MMPVRFSQAIANKVEADPRRFHSYDFDSDGHWVLTTDEYITPATGGQIIHTTTAKDTLIEMNRTIKRKES